MPGKYLDYYQRVADRMLPYLQGRKAAIEQRFPGSSRLTYRRHAGGAGEDTWIRIEAPDDVLHWVRQYAEGFHGYIRSDDRGAWFVIDIDSRELPLEMARLAASHAAEVLTDAGIDSLIKFSGSDGFHLMWDVPDLQDVSEAELWEMERAVVRAVACEVERRLTNDPRAEPIRQAVGEGNPLITTGSADRENPHALLFDQFILKENANFRVPYSIHPTTGLTAIPVKREDLDTFAPEDATPDKVAASKLNETLPRVSLERVRRALAAWEADGC